MNPMTMTTEMQMLLYAIVLGIVQILAAAQMATAQLGAKWNLSARDKKTELTGIAARLDRAYKNFLQTFAFFAAGVLMVHLTGRSSTLTVLGAQLYFYARLVYVPLYAFGIPVVRTLVWLTSVVGIVLVLIPLFGN